MTRIGDLGTFERFDVEPLAAFSPDGSTLATVDGDLVTLWDVDERTPITSFTEDAPVTDIDVAADNRTVALTIDDAGDNWVTVWDAVDRDRFAELPLRSAGQVAFHADDTMVAVAGDHGIRFWDLDPGRATRRICATAGRSLTREEWVEFLPREPYRATCRG